MLNRRDLFRQGLAATTLGVLPLGAALSSVPGRPVTAIVDAGIPGATEMHTEFRRASAQLHAFTDDPGSVWMNVLEPALRVYPHAIAGYTRAATLFCLQVLAGSYGLSLGGHEIGPQRIDATGGGPAPFLDLRDARLPDARSAMTWMLVPRGG